MNPAVKNALFLASFPQINALSEGIARARLGISRFVVSSCLIRLSDMLLSRPRIMRAKTIPVIFLVGDIIWAVSGNSGNHVSLDRNHVIQNLVDNMQPNADPTFL